MNSTSVGQSYALQAAEKLVRNQWVKSHNYKHLYLSALSMASYDPSHDFLHVNRVRHMAMRLAKHAQDEQLDVPVNIFVVEMAALFHDLFECV